MTPPPHNPSPGLPGLAETLDDQVPAILRATQTPGITVAVADHTGGVYSTAFGLADLADDVPMLPGHVMPAGSLTKLALGITILQLVDQGALDLHRPIIDYTDLAAVNPIGCTPISAFHLGTHTAGLATDTYDATLGMPRPLAEHIAYGFAAASAREYGGVGARWAAPAGTYRYSNFGSSALGHLVERLTDLPFATNVHERVLAPLGLKSTCIPPTHTARDVPPYILGRRATGYARFGGWCVPTPHLNTALHPSTGMLTTARDLAHLAAATLLPDHPAFGTVLSERMVRHMVTRHVTADQAGQHVEAGLLLQMGDLATPDAWVGGGGQYPWGWNARSKVMPHRKLVVVAIANGWDMARYLSPPGRTASGLVTELVTRWARRAPAHPRDPVPAWSELTAYAAGALLVTHTTGLLDAGPLGTDRIAAMAAGTRHVTSPDAAWDQDAFAAGALDATAAGADPATIDAALDAAPGGRFAMDLQALSWGATAAAFPAPLNYFAHRLGEDEARHLDAYRT